MNVEIHNTWLEPARAPARIQRKRTKGWKMPENTIYVGRPTKFGNPYPVSIYGRKGSMRLFKEWLTGNYKEYPIALDNLIINLHLLRGKNLACYCPIGKPCHANILLEMANK